MGAPAAVVADAPVRSREAAVAEAPLRQRMPGVGEMEWEALAKAVAECRACGLCEGRTNTVFGVGDLQADWMVIGEAPGENEDLQGEPFVGQAGKLLDNMLAALGIGRRKGVYKALYHHIQQLAAQDPKVCGFRLYVERENSRAQETYRALGMTQTHYLLFEALKPGVRFHQ